MRTRRLMSLLVLTFSFMLLGTVGAQGAAASSTLEPGDSGPEVYRLQTALEEWRPGIMNGSVGGQTTARYGPRTLGAVHQAARELRGHQNPSSTYTVGPLFWAALNDANGGGSTSATSSGSSNSSSGGGSSSAGQTVAAAARAQVGTPQGWGGNGPNLFDCSGLVAHAWNSAGVSLPRVSSSQFANATRVSRSNAQAGDIIAYDYDRVPGISHVAIYVGNGQMVEASGSQGRVVEGPVRSRGLVGFARPN